MMRRPRIPLAKGYPGVRNQTDHNLAKLPNVWATAYGLKRSNGKLTNTLSYVVFVKKKLPMAKLNKRAKVPKTVESVDISLPTDVIELRRLRLQAGFGQPRGALAIRSGSEQGTLACFAKSGEEFYGVSCAHVTQGSNSNVLTPNEITMWNTDKKDWIPVGRSERAALENGNGFPPDFGLLDAGLFIIQDPSLKQLLPSLPPLTIFTSSFDANVPEIAQGMHLKGEGAVSGSHSGIVTAVWMQDVRGQGVLADLVIESPTRDGMTMRGDSGMLWLDDAGQGVAVHVAGDDQGPGSPSRICVATFLYRIRNRFGVIPLRLH